MGERTEQLVWGVSINGSTPYLERGREIEVGLSRTTTTTVSITVDDSTLSMLNEQISSPNQGRGNDDMIRLSLNINRLSGEFTSSDYQRFGASKEWGRMTARGTCRKAERKF